MAVALWGSLEITTWGKKSMFGGVGGMDLASYDRCLRELRLSSLFYRSLGRVHLIGMNSSLITLPSFEADCDPDQLSSWYALREAHLEDLQACIQKIPEGERLLFFLHDPSALPFLSAFPWIRRCFPDWMALGWGISTLPVSLNSVIIFQVCL